MESSEKLVLFQVTTITDPTGPPFVDIPILMDSSSLKVGQIQVRLSLASEEYGPISHYWLIVVPGNYSNVRSQNLQLFSIAEFRMMW